MIVPLLIILVYLKQITAEEDNAPKSDIVTICNSTCCDDLKPIKWCSNPSELHGYITSESGDRFKHFVANFKNKNGNSGADLQITINPCKEYRKIIGFGGALTDASLLMMSCLKPDTRKKLLNLYFHCETGIGYYLLRIPLGGSDFSLSNYTYCDSATPDRKLTKFALHEMDLKYKIPTIKEAQAISCRKIYLKGAPWYSPAWMTADGTGNMTKIFAETLPPELADFFSMAIPSEWKSFPQKRVKEGDERIWAQYLAKTLKEYERQNVPITYLSPTNEPQLSAVSRYWPRDRYQKWVTDILCVVLKEYGCDSVNLLGLDDQTPFLPFWQKMFENYKTRSCFKGIATHWYFDYFPDTVKSIHDEFCEKYPEKILLPTEACTCEHDPSFFYTSDWDKAVRYAKDIILKLLHCGQGYIDWNMVLDFQGGPNWIKNYCYAPVAVNCEADEFHVRVLFYVLGHFSKLLPEGSVRVDTKTYPDELADSVVAFKVKSPGCSRPSIVVIALNTNDQDVTTDICLENGKCTTIKLPKNSITSAVFSLTYNYVC